MTDQPDRARELARARQAARRRREREAGVVEVLVAVPGGRVAEIREIARRMREEAAQPAGQSAGR